MKFIAIKEKEWVIKRKDYIEYNSENEKNGKYSLEDSDWLALTFDIFCITSCDCNIFYSHSVSAFDESIPSFLHLI